MGTEYYDLGTQTRNRNRNILVVIFTVLRILIGWHFLYEGLSKLLSPWSSAGYLMGSQWLFSGFFHWIAKTQGHVCVGMFDFQLIDDANIVNEVLADLKRERPWRG